MNLREVHPVLYVMFVVLVIVNYLMRMISFDFLFQVFYAVFSAFLVFIGFAFEYWRLHGDELDYQTLLKEMEKRKKQK